MRQNAASSGTDACIMQQLTQGYIEMHAFTTMAPLFAAYLGAGEQDGMHSITLVTTLPVNSCTVPACQHLI